MIAAAVVLGTFLFRKRAQHFGSRACASLRYTKGEPSDNLEQLAMARTLHRQWRPGVLVRLGWYMIWSLVR
jgi:hypothetical protein